MLFLKGFLIGLSVAAPIGPVALLCIRRTLAFGRRSGFFSGLGAAIGDGLYSAIAAFGLIWVSQFLQAWANPLRWISGVALFLIGFFIFRGKHDPRRALVTEAQKNAQDFFSTFFLLLTNPLTFFIFTGIFAGFGVLSGNVSREGVGVLVLGISFGAICWWLFLIWVVSLIGKRLPEHILFYINKIAGLLLMIFGVIAFSSALEHLLR